MYGLILAGGKSRRMGQDKALLKRDGRSQLASLVALLEPMVERVFVSTRPDQTDEPERRRFAQIIDRYSHIGPVAGVLSAMDDYPAVDWLVVACDLPNVDQLTIRHLIDHRAVARAVRPSFETS
jgi:molybdopterin-guanine dinucleotide biosynthesis protein A